jgi:4-amino-4-deoxy-L-arabinose transferase-like glycosyltransferase
MLNSQRLFLYGMNLLFDSLFLFFILILSLGGASWKDFGIFLVVMAAAALISGGLFTFKQSLFKFSLAITFIFVFLSLWALSSSLLLSVILSLLFTWRAIVNWEDLLKSDIEGVLILSVVSAVLLSIFLKEGYELLYGTLFIQFVLLLIIKMYVHYVRNQPKDKKQSSWVWKDFYVPLFLLLAGLLMFVLMGPLKSMLLFLLYGFFDLLYYVIAPLWKLFGLIASLLSVPLHFIARLFQGEERVQQSETGDLIEEQFKDDYILKTMDYSWLLWVVIGILVLLAAFYLLKKRLSLNLSSNALLNGSVSTIDAAASTPFTNSRKWLKPKDRTRKKFSQFEKSMHKRGFARLPGESVSQWFDRLNLNSQDAEHVSHFYEKVRYGEQSLDDEEFNTFIESLKKIDKSVQRKEKKPK